MFVWFVRTCVCVACMCYPFVNPINLFILNVVVYESACRHLLYQKPCLLKHVLIVNAFTKLFVEIK